MTYANTATDSVNVGDKVRVVYPKKKYRSPHRTDGIYMVEKIDAAQDIYWVRYLQDTNKVTVVKRSYIKNVISSKFEGLR